MIPFNKNNKNNKIPIPEGGRRRRGQNVTEYLILVAGVVAVVIVAASSKGFFTQGVNKALNTMFDSVEDMATVQCLGTLDDVNGVWSGFGSWAPCTSCSQTHTRTCTNPAPKCNGSTCVLSDGTLGLVETESQSCVSGVWVVGACGTCTGDCQSASGTCTQAVICSGIGGCCDDAVKPSATASCTKLPYPDVWTGLGFGSCSASCGAGIASQSVTCSGNCCDALIKPSTRSACTQDCCAQSLSIGIDVVTGTDFMGTFGPAANGAFVTLTCPPGYAGSPTRACTATASGSCTGDDSYSPPSSCYTISWGALIGECQPASCPAETVTIGVGLSYAFPETVNGGTVNISCAGYDEGPACGQKRYEGTVSRSCSLGTWSAVSGSCDFKNCSPPETFCDPNGNPGLCGTFPDSLHGDSQTLACAAIDSRYTGDFSRTCDYGEWCSPTGGCTAQPCSAATINSNGVNLTFTAAAHGTPQTVRCEDFSGNTSTGNVSSQCCFGTWIDPNLGCTGSEPQGYTGGCRAFACRNTFVTFPVAGATSCGDDTGLIADEDWSVVNNGGCTATKTCEYQCNPGYVKLDNACVAPVMCEGGNPDPNGFATACSGDDPPSVNTLTTLSSSCSSPAGSEPKCEYTCNSGYVLSGGACCKLACPLGSCGTQTVCGQTLDCGACCGNGAFDTGEKCDGTKFGILTCNSAIYGFTGNCGSLSCSADCASISTAGCRNAVNGNWSGPWVNNGACDQFKTCEQRQDRTCVGASCGGTCPGPKPPPRFVPCAVACCGDTDCNGSETCSTCPTDCGACCVPTTCAAKGLCNGGSTAYEDGCGATINCKMCPQWITMPSITITCSPYTSCDAYGQCTTITGTLGAWSGTKSCGALCASYGLSSGFDLNGKICKSIEAAEGGSGIVQSGTEPVSCSVDMYGSIDRSFYSLCYNDKQKQDGDNTDLITACYCL